MTTAFLQFYNNDPQDLTSGLTMYRDGSGNFYNVVGSTQDIFKYLYFYDDNYGTQIGYNLDNVNPNPNIASQATGLALQEYNDILSGVDLNTNDLAATVVITVVGGTLGAPNDPNASTNLTNSGTTYTATVGSGLIQQLMFYPAPDGTASKITIEIKGSAGVADTTSGFYVYANCFTAGTMIACPDGERSVESLKAGDLVITASGDVKPVRFLGRQRIDLGAAPDRAPVRIPASAFADGLPRRDLRLSPDHAVVFDNVLIPVRSLLGGAVVQEEISEITYYHIQLDSHDVVLAEGLPCETLLETDDLSCFDNAEEAVPSDAFLAPCLPRVTQGPVVEAARAAIRARALATV